MQKKIQQLGRKRPRLFPGISSPARETRATATQGKVLPSPWETPAPLTRGQAPKISFFKCTLGAISAILIGAIVIISILLHYRAQQPKPTQTALLVPPATAAQHATKTTPLVSNEVSSWNKISVLKGDNLANIFKRLKIKHTDLLHVVKQYPHLTQLHPGEVFYLQIDNQHRLNGMQYPINRLRTLHLTRAGDHYAQSMSVKPTTTTLSFKSLVIHHSLSKAAHQAGLSHALIHELQTVFAGTINFRHDIRPGDRFDVLYQELYANGTKVRNGDIQVAELTHAGKTYQVVRYNYPSANPGYYTPDGKAVEARFLPTPLHYKRISSRFSYRRMDPILHEIRPHLGVDFAAPIGTPIKSIGDGRIVFIGRDGGYGNTIKIRYGRHYQGLYAHMQHFAKNMKLHQYVHKDEIIGYVGQSGWATGPHLHFGFFVDGVARNWLAVKLPNANPIPLYYLTRFKATAKHLLTELQIYQRTYFAAYNKKAARY